MTELFEIKEMESKSPALKRVEQFVQEHGVETHYNADCSPPWTAWVGGFDRLAGYCSVMEDLNELRYGETERDAIEALAEARNFSLSNVEDEHR